MGKRAFKAWFFLPNFKFIGLDHEYMLVAMVGYFEKNN